MKDLNKITETAETKIQGVEEKQFFTNRGVSVSAIEITGYTCVDAVTARTLEEIIKGKTDKLNRIKKQDAQNEVDLKKIKADIELEKKRNELLQEEQKNSQKLAELEGQAEGTRIA